MAASWDRWGVGRRCRMGFWKCSLGRSWQPRRIVSHMTPEAQEKGRLQNYIFIAINVLWKSITSTLWAFSFNGDDDDWKIELQNIVNFIVVIVTQEKARTSEQSYGEFSSRNRRKSSRWEFRDVFIVRRYSARRRSRHVGKWFGGKFSKRFEKC